MRVFFTICVLGLSVVVVESLRQLNTYDRTPRRGSIAGLAIPPALRPVLQLAGLFSLPLRVLEAIVPRLTQIFANIPRPGGSGSILSRPLLGSRPLISRPLSSRPLTNLITSATSSGGTTSTGTAATTGNAAGSVGNAGTFFFRRSTELSPWDITGIIKKVKNNYRKYQMDNPDCQHLLTCEMYRKSFSPRMGDIADKLLRIIGTETRLERSTFASNTKMIIKDHLKAVRYGLTHKDCSAIYFRCSEEARPTARLI